MNLSTYCENVPLQPELMQNVNPRLALLLVPHSLIREHECLFKDDPGLCKQLGKFSRFCGLPCMHLIEHVLVGQSCSCRFVRFLMDFFKSMPEGTVGDL